MRVTRWRAWLVVLICILATIASGQTASGQTSSGPQNGPAVLSSVNQTALANLEDQEVKATGIIGHYSGDQNHYNFTMDDGSEVNVIGKFPSMGGVHYDLHARVTRLSNGYVLEEIDKTPTETSKPQAAPGAPAATLGATGATAGAASKGTTGGGGTGENKGEGKMDPLMVGGAGLLGVAAITVIAMSVRTKAAEKERKRQLEADIERARQADMHRAVQPPVARAETVAAPVQAVRQATVASVGRIIVTSGPDQGKTFALLEATTKIGRGVANDVALSDQSVSTEHAQIIVTSDRRIIFRDDSRNGSTVNGQIVSHGELVLTSSFTVKIGATEMKVETQIGGTAAPDVTPIAKVDRSAVTSYGESPSGPVPAAPTEIGYGAEFVLLSGNSAGKTWQVSGPLTTIGRDAQDVLLDDVSVSRKHGTLAVTDGRFILRDVGSTHGTKVNDERVPADGVELNDGDMIQFGKSLDLLEFHCVKR